MSEYRDFQSQLKEYGIDPKYGLGQNFIYEHALLDELASYALIKEDTDSVARILEIGAGFGTLTEALLRNYPQARLLSYEIDESLKARLTDLEAQYPNFSVNWGDARHADFSADAAHLSDEIVADGLLPNSLHMVANLPYYITTELMQKALIAIPDAKTMCFMVQAEVWERIRALPKDGKTYGPLAILCHLYGSIEKVMDLPAAVFYPAPRVNSIFVRLTRISDPAPNPLFSADGQAFVNFVTMLLAARRKTLLNNLNRSTFDADRKRRITDKLMDLGHSAQVRAEKLEPHEFAQLFYA